MQPTAVHHKRLAAGLVGRQQFIAQSDPPAQLDAARDANQKVVGRPLDEETVAPHGLQDAAQLARRLQQRDRSAGLSSSSRCAAARPVMPPPMMATRAGGAARFELAGFGGAVIEFCKFRSQAS